MVTADAGQDDQDGANAQAVYLSTAGPLWREMEDIAYDPYADCTLAQVIAEHEHGSYECDELPAPRAGVHF